MSYITEETSEIILNQELPPFSSNAILNKGVLNLSTTDQAEMTKLFGDFSAALAATTAAKASAKSITSDKNAKKKAVKTLIARFAKTWRANPLVPDSVLESLFLPNHSTPPTFSPPTQPANLRLGVDNVGLITLSWGRNGNKSGTVFNVETADSASGTWSIFDSTTKAKMEYPGTAGQEVWFRVVAKRNGLTSQYSLPISLWAGNGGGAVSLEVAA